MQASKENNPNIALSVPDLKFSLESLPQLLGKSDMGFLLTALENAVNDPNKFGHARIGRTDGEYLVALVHMAAHVRSGRGPA